MSPEVVNLILKALDANGDAVFSREDIAGWPKEDFEEALRTGLLEKAAPADEVVCSGCKEACLEDVEFIYGDTPAEARAYVACADLGRVRIELKTLDRWAVNRERANQLRPPAGGKDGKDAEGEEETAPKVSSKPIRPVKPPKQLYMDIAKFYESSGRTGKDVAEQIQDYLSKQGEGVIVNQQKVSHAVIAVNKWRAANPELGLPQIQTRKKKVSVAVDPDVIALGQRTRKDARQYREATKKIAGRED